MRLVAFPYTVILVFPLLLYWSSLILLYYWSFLILLYYWSFLILLVVLLYYYAWRDACEPNKSKSRYLGYRAISSSSLISTLPTAREIPMCNLNL